MFLNFNKEITILEFQKRKVRDKLLMCLPLTLSTCTSSRAKFIKRVSKLYSSYDGLISVSPFKTS